MPITVVPSEAARNILTCQAVGNWSWHDLHNILKRCMILSQGFSSPPNIIFDVTASGAIPSLTSLMPYRRYNEVRLSHLGAFIVVGAYTQAIPLFYALQQIFCVGALFFVVDSVSKAEQMASIYYGIPARSGS